MRLVPGNGFEAFRQLARVYGSADQDGTTGLFVQTMTFKFGNRVEEVEECLSEHIELAQH